MHLRSPAGASDWSSPIWVGLHPQRLKSQQNTFSYVQSRLGFIFFFSPLMKNDRPLLRWSLTPGRVHFQILIYDDTLSISPARQICSVNNLPGFGGDAELPENVSDTGRKTDLSWWQIIMIFCVPCFGLVSSETQQRSGLWACLSAHCGAEVGRS